MAWGYGQFVGEIGVVVASFGVLVWVPAELGVPRRYSGLVHSDSCAEV